MISVSHAVTGAYISSILPQPYLYIPLALMSHYILDYIAHYDVGVIMRQHHLSRWSIIIWEGLDLAGAVLLVALFWHQTPSHFTPHIWFGAFFGILPDIIEATDYFFHQPAAIFQPFYYLHERFHHSTNNAFWGLLPQIILVSIIGWLVLRS